MPRQAAARCSARPCGAAAPRSRDGRGSACSALERRGRRRRGRPAGCRLGERQRPRAHAHRCGSLVLVDGPVLLGRSVTLGTGSATLPERGVRGHRTPGTGRPRYSVGRELGRHAVKRRWRRSSSRCGGCARTRCGARVLDGGEPGPKEVALGGSEPPGRPARGPGAVAAAAANRASSATAASSWRALVCSASVSWATSKARRVMAAARAACSSASLTVTVSRPSFSPCALATRVTHALGRCWVRSR